MQQFVMRILKCKKIASKGRKKKKKETCARVENFRQITFIINLFNFFFYILIYFFDQFIVETVYFHRKLF